MCQWLLSWRRVWGAYRRMRNVHGPGLGFVTGQPPASEIALGLRTWALRKEPERDSKDWGHGRGTR